VNAELASQPPKQLTDFDRLLVDMEQEAQAEGHAAVNELEQLRHEFGLASARIASRSV
jgi:hypothetical protein